MRVNEKPPTNERYTSIIIASYIPDELRAKMFRTSLDTLLETTEGLPVEIIIVDNGGNVSLSGYIDGLLLGGAVQTVIHNANNMHFGFARNQGLASANGNYIVIADNDILYRDGWLEACWKVLEAYPLRKFWATPIQYPMESMAKRYDQGVIDVDGEEYRLNMRAGSNCWVTRRKDFYEVGIFKNHRVAGSVWTDEAVHKGYCGAVTPENMVADLGFRAGYNHRQPLPVKRTLRNGEEVLLNEDEYIYGKEIN